MNHDDARLDATLDAIARPEPPADHVARVLARTGSQDDERRVAAAETLPSPAAYGRLRRLAPALAAGVLLVITAAWQMEQAARPDIDSTLQATASASPTTSVAAPDLNLPVLPPQAYWAMDAFDEFASLRPAERGAGRQQTPRPVPSGGTGSQLAASVTPASPSGLPPIELEDISPTPLTVVTADPLDAIAVPEIEVAPIVVPVIEEEIP